MPEFTSGVELSRLFYEEAVGPLLEGHFPGLHHSAALVGSGSEVLGFDDVVSSDHHWGPRVMLFFEQADHERWCEAIDAKLRASLPPTIAGYATNWGAPDANDNGTQKLALIEHGPINHRVELLTVHGFVWSYLGFDIDQPIGAADWLTFPQQKLRTLTAGAVFRDDVGLEVVRRRLAYYPPEVWLYLLAAQWTRIGQEEHLMGRAGSVGDEIGSSLIAARLVRDLMQLGFLMERQYAPYPKWFGTAFQKLACAPELTPLLRAVLAAKTWQERKHHLVSAYEHLARMHNELSITDPMPTEAGPFWGRPFKVIEHTAGFAEAIRARITDPEVARLAEGRLIGSVDQFSDSTDIRSEPSLRPALRGMYTGLADE